MTASPVTVQDPNTPANQLTINGLGQIGIANFPSQQSVIGSVSITNFPAVQPVSGTADVTDRASRVLGHVIVDTLPGGTTNLPFYQIIQDPTTSANKLKVNSDGSLNISGSVSATNPSVGTTGSTVPASGTYMAANKSGNLTGLSLDTSGNLNVNVQSGGGSNASVGTDGSAIPTSSTLIGASDGTNLQQLLVESSSNRNLRVGLYSGANEATVTGANALKVDNSGVTQPISGTITANVGTTNGLALDASIGKLNVAQAAALGGSTGPMVQGSVTTSAPSYTTGQINPLSLTTAGALRVDASATTQPVSGTFWQATQPVSGTVTANQGGSNWSQNLAQVGGSSFALGQQLAAASLPIVLTSAQLTTLTPLSTITANIGTTNGLALDSSVNGVLVAQGSTTSGEKGPLIQGAVTTSAPSYTTAQTSPLSLTTAGGLRVDGSGVTQPVSGTVTANAGTNLNTSALALETGGNLATLAGGVSSNKYQVQQNASVSVSGTLQNTQTGNANGTPLSVLGMSSCVLTVNMSGFTGTVNFEGQEDGTNFGALHAVLIGTSTITTTAVGSTTTSIARYEIPCAGLQQIQARTSGVSAGSVTVTAHAVPVGYTPKVVNVANANANGQTTKANSAPVVIASDQWSAGSPNITEQNIQNWIRNGQGFFGSTGLQTIGAGVNAVEFSLFNPNATKNILIYSLRAYTSVAAYVRTMQITTNPSLANSVTPVNANLAATSSVASVTYALTAQSVSGNPLSLDYSSGNPSVDVIVFPGVFILPANANNGVAVFMNITAAATLGFSAKWIEF